MDIGNIANTSGEGSEVGSALTGVGLANLQEAVALHLEDEDPEELGLVPDPSIRYRP